MFGVMFIFVILDALTITVYTDTILEKLDLGDDLFEDAQQDIIDYYLDQDN